MPVRGFCEHKRVWTTCPICGKDVIKASKGRAPPEEYWGEGIPKPQPRAVKPPPPEPAEGAEESSED